ncbi:hypothetical protein, unlikely [Trypanosoma congolense IL3000]|uniref:Uncharacterized protein n=1 Tax=Trypanosoma congolense (strain IL3000) TaxID=1068625 RepID=F9W533_TRYCI|nr:hypothetical protein, unlikely [Trypanosoma congolense IL3000]
MAEKCQPEKLLTSGCGAHPTYPSHAVHVCVPTLTRSDWYALTPHSSSDSVSSGTPDCRPHRVERRIVRRRPPPRTPHGRTRISMQCGCCQPISICTPLTLTYR